MWGIADEHILEHIRGEQTTPEYDSESAVTLAYNHTDPTVISDGIDRVIVVEESEDRYLVDYWGFEVGYLRITHEGVNELGKSLLGDQGDVPDWLITSSESVEDFPDWIPADYDGVPVLLCDHCGGDTPAGEILTPGRHEQENVDHFCPECWDELQNRWHPEHGVHEPSARKRASDVRDIASAEPASVDIEVLGELVQTEDPDVQRDALHALIDVIDARPEDTLELLPLLQARLKSQDILVRCAALYCIADLAEVYPRQVTPFADDVISLLSPENDEGILEGAIPFVAAVADHEPNVVLDAVPRLGALLQSGTPFEQDVIVALTRIARAYPASVLPAIDELLSYVERENANHRVAALAAVGHVAKEYPNVAESSTATVIELLDADSDRLRANAGGLLADLAGEYPSAVRPAVPRTIEMLTDEDEKARYNATSVLARVAKVYPNDVKPAIEPLVSALDEELSYSRSNACWALGYLEAEQARDTIMEVARSDPDEEVRAAAEWALDQFEETSD